MPRYQFDFRNAVRFPLHLRVVLKMPTGKYLAETINISSGGALIHTEFSIAVDSELEFVIEMPEDAFGTGDPVLVICRGRVVRCSEEAAGCEVAVIIDDYDFGRI